jgi:hypothetical protein
MEPTRPLDVTGLREAFPRDVQGMEDGELRVMLELEEVALRDQFGVTRTDPEANAAVRRAMLMGWLSFRQQLRQIAQETVGVDSTSTTAARAGVIDFTWPAFVGMVLARVATVEEAGVQEAPSTTQLVRG